MRGRRNIENINKKCSLLMELGFDIHHEDSRVEYNGVFFDFSEVSCDPASILKIALNIMFEHGLEQGRKEIQDSIKALLKL